MFISTIASVVGIAGGINSLTGGGISNFLGGGGGGQQQIGGGGGTGTQQAADPFAPYRGGLAQQYSQALQPGATQDPTQMPGYSQWMSGVLQPAMQATQAQDVASGRAHSGQEQQDLLAVGQKGYYGFMTDYMNRLAQGSGAVNNPAQAVGMGLNQQAGQQQGFMQGVGGIMQGIQGFQGGNTQMQVPPGAGTDYGPSPDMGGYGSVDPNTMALGGW